TISTTVSRAKGVVPSTPRRARHAARRQSHVPRAKGTIPKSPVDVNTSSARLWVSRRGTCCSGSRLPSSYMLLSGPQPVSGGAGPPRGVRAPVGEPEQSDDAAAENHRDVVLVLAEGGDAHPPGPLDDPLRADAGQLDDGTERARDPQRHEHAVRDILVVQQVG